jgi:hypothetical protein
VLRALEKEPPRRYQHASDLKLDVERLSTPNVKPQSEPIAVNPIPPKPQSRPMDNPMRKHVTVLGVLHIAFGSIFLMIAAIVFVSVLGGGLISQDRDAITVTMIVATVVAGGFTIVSLPGIIAGVGLLKFKNWARILVLVIAVLNLFNLPFGTALSVYCFWVLLNGDAAELFDEEANWSS